MAVATEVSGPPRGWLRSANFDLSFIALPTLVALLSGWAVVMNPALFMPILLLDLWLLGYHHVIATYTRLCFDAESHRHYRFLLYGLPPIVVGGVLLLYFGFGAWAIATTYLYWQWFHYTRQSWGVGQVYRRKAGIALPESETFAKLAHYLVPLWGIAHRSYQAPETFLTLEVRTLPLPGIVVDLLGVAAALSVALWLTGRALAWYHDRLPLAHTLFMLSHFAIFYVGYIAIADITYGWLVINIWHNAQYLIFVWLFNTTKYRNGIDPKARFLSRISQPRNALLYFAVCFGISTAVYLGLAKGVALFSGLGLPLLLIVYQSINFHHYVVDGLIWKARRKPMQKTLGLAS